MKYLKINEIEKKDVSSILYKKTRGFYYFTNRGKSVGTIVTSGVNETLDMLSGKIKQIEDINLDEHDIDNIYFDKMTEQDNVIFSITDLNSINELPLGVFELNYSQEYGLVMEPYKSTINTGILIKNKNLAEEVTEFFNNPIKDRKNKKGYLLFGKPGNGKSSEILRLCEKAEANNFRVFIVDSKIRLNGLNGLRSMLEKDKTVFVIEEITERLSRNGAEELLTFLDGENSWNNSVTIATTNNPEELPANLVDRPGRFDTFIEYKNPTNDEIFLLAEAFNVEKTKVECLLNNKYSFDYVSFILSESKRTEKTPEEVKKIEADKRKLLSETFKGKMGLGFSHDD